MTRTRVSSLEQKNEIIMLFKESDDHKPILKRKARWQKANSNFIDLAQYMVKMPKNENDQKDKFKRPFFSECSGKYNLRHYYYKGFIELQRESDR